MDFFKNDFEQQWEELSSDINKHNKYTSTHSIELRKISVGGKKLMGAIFTAATFDGVEWKNTNQEAIITKTFFKNCTFYNVEFGGSTMLDVRFKGCKITDSRFEELSGNELIIKNTYYLSAD